MAAIAASWDLPNRRFAESTACIRESIRKLRGCDKVRAKMLIKTGIGLEDGAWVALWVKHTNHLADLVANDRHGHEQIGVTADDDGAVESVEMRVMHELNSEIHVGAFFLRLHHHDCRGLSRRRICEKHPYIFCKEMTVLYFHSRQGLQGSKEGFLANRRIQIVGTWTDLRGEVFDSYDLIVGMKVKFKQPAQIQPFVWRSTDRTEIEIESVYVSDCPHGASIEKNKGQRFHAGPRPLRRSYSGG